MYEWLACARLLEHRIRVWLGELELAEGAMGRLTHYEVLPRSVNVTEAALQRVGVEERAAARRLEGDCSHPLRHLSYVHGSRARLGLHCRRRHPPRPCFRPGARQNLECQRTG